jgi:hypothetical protein
LNFHVHHTTKEPQEQYLQPPQLQPQLVYRQPRQQETPKLSEEEQRILAIPLICNNWERTWEELMHHGLHDKKKQATMTFLRISRS